MMDRPGVLSGRIDPDTHRLQHEKIVLIHQDLIGHHALDIGPTAGQKRRPHRQGRMGGDPELLEFIRVLARTIAYTHHGRGHFHRGYRDHAFPRIFQQAETMVALTEDDPDEWWLKIHHEVPG